MSTEKLTIHQALAAVMADVGAVRKQERNAQQGWNFRGIDAVVKAVYPALVKHGVVVLPNLIDMTYSTVEIGQKRTPMGHCQVTVEYLFIGPAGDVLTARVAAEAMDSGDKGTAKAMSVALRTALLQTLCLPTDEPDPDHDIYERSVKDMAASSATVPNGNPAEKLHLELADIAVGLDVSMDQITAKFREANGGITLAEFYELPADRVRPFVREVSAFAANQPTPKKK